MLDITRKLTQNILIVIFGLFLLHTLVFIILYFSIYLADSSLRLYLFVSLPFTAALIVVLMLMRKHFYFVKDNSPMKGFGIADLFTLFRITSVPILLILIINFIHRPEVLPYLIIYIAISFITDFLDGKISRARNEVTKIGQYMDSISDYVILFMVGIAFGVYQIVDSWFLIIVIARYAIQWILAMVLFFKRSTEEFMAATTLGKISVFATMAIFVLALAKVLPFLGNFILQVNQIVLIIELIVALILLVSLVEKIILFSKGMKYTANQS